MVVIGDKNIRELTGIVVSAKGEKTIVISVDRVKMHSLYKKRFTVNKKYHAHDEQNQAQKGDIVRIRECKPYSKLKKWRLVEIISQEQAA